MMFRRLLADTIALTCIAILVWSLVFGWNEMVRPDQLGFLVFLVCCIGSGWLIAIKRPENAIGWLVLVIPLLFLLEAPTHELGYALKESHPRIATVFLLYGNRTDNTFIWLPPLWIMLSQIPLRFPTGSVPSRRWRWFGWFTIAAVVFACLLFVSGIEELAPGLPNPFYWDDSTDPGPLVGTLIVVAFGALAICMLGSITSMFVRYRSGDAVTRTQQRWVFWALAVVIASLLASWAAMAFGLEIWTGGAVVYALVPISILVAVTRNGLYDIDRIISRTLSYAVSFGFAVAIYAGVVVAISSLVHTDSHLPVAGATLAAAAAFFPLLRWFQDHLDRRFDRARYDAQQVVDAFGRRLRDGADPHTTAPALADAVQRTLRPTSLGVWTR